MFYGESLNIWFKQDIENSDIVLTLVTASGNKYKTTVCTNKYGKMFTLPYSDFKNIENISPSLTEVSNIEELIISFNDYIYIDDIRVLNPRNFNVASIPANDTGNSNVVVNATNENLGGLKYNIGFINSGHDSIWATELLLKNHIIDTEYDVALYQIDFLDSNFIVKNLPKGKTVEIGFEWDSVSTNEIIYIADDGSMTMLESICVDSRIFANISKSGMYAVVVPSVLLYDEEEIWDSGCDTTVEEGEDNTNNKTTTLKKNYYQKEILEEK